MFANPQYLLNRHPTPNLVPIYRRFLCRCSIYGSLVISNKWSFATCARVLAMCIRGLLCLRQEAPNREFKICKYTTVITLPKCLFPIFIWQPFSQHSMSMNGLSSFIYSFKNNLSVFYTKCHTSVYFDQLLGDARTRKLVEIHNKLLHILCYFCSKLLRRQNTYFNCVHNSNEMKWNEMNVYFLLSENELLL